MKNFKKNEWLTMVIGKFRRGPIGIGILVAAVLIWEGHRYFTREEHLLTDSRYLVAVRDLEAGEKFALRDFTYTFDTPNDARAYTDQDIVYLVGKKYASPVAAGQYLIGESVSGGVFSDGIPKGSRAYAFSAENRFPLQSGDRIDVFTRKDGKGSRLLLENIVVLQKRGDGAEVSVAATRQDIELLENAQDSGKLVVALRNPLDSETGGLSVTRPKKRIEVMTEGE